MTQWEDRHGAHRRFLVQEDRPRDSFSPSDLDDGRPPAPAPEAGPAAHPRRGGGEDEGERHERLLEWIESRHRARPGIDWHAIEAENLQASFAYAAAMEKARGGKPAWRERGPV